MKCIFYLLICLILILIQTTIIPCFRLLSGFYDLFIPIIVYFGLYRKTRESVLVILFLGLIMDNMSNGPFGLYISVYFWLYAAMRWSSVYFHVRNKPFMIFTVASGVLFENLIFIGSFFLFNPNAEFPGNAPGNALEQILWALLTGSFFLMFINRSFHAWSTRLDPGASGQSGRV